MRPQRPHVPQGWARAITHERQHQSVSTGPTPGSHSGSIGRFLHRRRLALASTLGEHGVAWLDDTGVLQRLPAFAGEVVDPTGAGVVFHGALAFALGTGLPAAQAFRFSAAVAALKCRQAGGRTGAPDLATTCSFLQDIQEHTA